MYMYMGMSSMQFTGMVVIMVKGRILIIIAWPRSLYWTHLYKRDAKNARFDVVFNLITYPCDELQQGTHN